jgi:hypothetical protein
MTHDVCDVRDKEAGVDRRRGGVALELMGIY